MTCPFAGAVTAVVYNEGGKYICYPSLNDIDDKNDKESEKSPMRVIGRGLWKPWHCCRSCHGRCERGSAISSLTIRRPLTLA